MSEQIIGRRIKALREKRNLTQDELADLFEFNDRQTVSAIETGARRVTADELVLAAEKLGEPIDYFTDPFRLVGEGCFSWRQTSVNTKQLDAYEQHAGSWIAAFRTLRSQVGHEIPLLRHTLTLDRYSSYEDAMQAGERFVSQFELGKAPALQLAEVMENELDILVLMVDATDGVSGAACHLADLDAVLIARHEVSGRRHFDLAHELFHILTWEAMPPKHIEEVEEKPRNRVEQLANNFAAAVLMPSEVLDQFGDWSDLTEEKLIAHLNLVADELHVTSSALKWRLTALGKIKKTIANSLPEAKLHNNGRSSATEKVPPPLFSPSFLEVIGNAIEEGKVSVRRLARLLDMSVDDLSNLFTEHGLKSPIFL
ncbi:MAG: XRE family transcriptional regulator [Gammaproteobacteria bacterium]|nr:XRE family transcriptional regulator [Gammaproteobacteria bacterium]MDE0611346.1 XRE family transcriptional regulator [Gammaproteobacteria bacterium]